jgi:alpha-1,3-rhamnosyltransferase
MSNLPLVTVYLLAYNHEKYIEQAVMSVINQTYPNIQLIILNDGSVDKTFDILKELHTSYGFTLINQANKGVTKSLNKIMPLWNGKYIRGCSSDDYLSPDSIEKQVDFLEKNRDFAMVYGLVKLIDENGNFIQTKYAKKYPSGNIFYDLMRSNFINALTVMVRKSVYDEVGLYDENLLMEDHDMWLRIAYHFKIAFMDEVFAFYRKHSENTDSIKNYKKLYPSHKMVVNKWKNQLNIRSFNKIRRFKYIHYFYNMIRARRFYSSLIVLIKYFNTFLNPKGDY